MYSLLIVEDEPFTRRGLETTIDWTNLGVTTIYTAKNGKEGFEAALKYNPDFILTDIRMPVLSGLDMVKKIRETTELKAEIALLSGFAEFEYAKIAIEYGVTNYLLKPVKNEELILTFKKMIQTVERRNKAIAAERILDNSKDELDTKIIKIFVHDNYTDLEEVKKELEFNNRPFIECGRVVMVSLNKDESEDPEEIFEFSKLLHEGLNERNLVFNSGVYHSKVVAIVETNDAKLLKEILDSTFEKIESLTNKTFCAGISGYFETVKQIHKSYEEAKALVSNDLFKFKNNVQIYGSINLRSKTLIEALNIIHSEYMKDISIGYVSEKLNVSDSHIMHMFKNELGTTFNKLLLSVRLEEAKKLLESGKYRVNEVAYMVGFNDEKYFTILFKRNEGITPSQFMKNKQ